VRVAHCTHLWYCPLPPLLRLYRVRCQYGKAFGYAEFVVRVALSYPRSSIPGASGVCLPRTDERQSWRCPASEASLRGSLRG